MLLASPRIASIAPSFSRVLSFPAHNNSFPLIGSDATTCLPALISLKIGASKVYWLLFLHMPPPCLAVNRPFPKGAESGSNPRERERERERESFAFAPWCGVQDTTRCFFGSGGGTSSIRGPPSGEGEPRAWMTYQEEFMACLRKGRRGNGTPACVANSPSR